jgi:hypothetical protein
MGAALQVVQTICRRAAFHHADHFHPASPCSPRTQLFAARSGYGWLFQARITGCPLRWFVPGRSLLMSFTVRRCGQLQLQR